MQVSGDGGLGIVNPLFVLSGQPSDAGIDGRLTGWMFADTAVLLTRCSTLCLMTMKTGEKRRTNFQVTVPASSCNGKGDTLISVGMKTVHMNLKSPGLRPL